MKRVLRELIRALTALSLLLFLTTTVLWVRGRWVGDLIEWVGHEYGRDEHRYVKRWRYFYSGSGGVLLSSSGTDERFRSAAGLRRRYEDPNTWSNFRRTPVRPPQDYRRKRHDPYVAWDFLGFQLNISNPPDNMYTIEGSYARPDNAESTYSTGHWGIGIPHWALALAFAAAPALHLRGAIRRRRRTLQGRCRKCGYDLRASPDRCPECGAVPDGAGSAGAG